MISLLLTLSCALITPEAPARTRPTPSFLVIVVDDLGTDNVDLYGESPSAPPTPNIDALAADGVWFRNAYVSPVCSSSRALLLTGRYGRRTGMGGIVDVGSDYELPLDEVTAPEALNRGKREWWSAAIGKWHLSGIDTPNAWRHPMLQGFDRARGSLGNVRNTEKLKKASFFEWEKNVDGKRKTSRDYATRDTTDEAIAALQEVEGPFFLWVAYNAAHEPFHWPPGTEGPRDQPVAQQQAMIRDVDRELGRLLGAMTPAQRETTTVVLVADNGTPEEVVRPPFDPTRAKGTLYEGGTNVPLIVSGAGVTGRGEAAGLVHGVDLLPTLLELAEVSSNGFDLDGVSFAPMLADPNARSARRYVYTERFRPNGAGPYSVDEHAIRDDQYKIIHFEDGGVARFDLADRNDDGPAVPVSVAPERFEALEAALQQIREGLSYGR